MIVYRFSKLLIYMDNEAIKVLLIPGLRGMVKQPTDSKNRLIDWIAKKYGTEMAEWATEYMRDYNE